MDIQKFAEEECYKCGVVFGVSQAYQHRRREDKAQFFCPNGHAQQYVKSTADQLRETLEMKSRQLEQKDMEVARLAKALKKLEKAKAK
jgi:hypothetical protein